MQPLMPGIKVDVVFDPNDTNVHQYVMGSNGVVLTVDKAPACFNVTSCGRN